MMYSRLSSNLTNVPQRVSSCLPVVVSCRQKNYYRGKKQQNLEKIIFEDKNVPAADVEDFEPGEFLPRRLTYMPPDLPQHAIPKTKPWKVIPPKISLKSPPLDKRPEYTENPEYPPIGDMQHGLWRGDSELRQKRLSWYKTIRSLGTFDEKQFEIMNQMALPTVKVSSLKPFYDYLPLYKYLTRTHTIDCERLPVEDCNESLVNELTEQATPLILAAVKAQLDLKQVQPFNDKTVIAIENEHRVPILKVENIIQNVNSTLIKLLSTHNQRLQDTVVS